MAAKNDAVVRAWAEGRVLRGVNMRTDGISLWSYRLQIGDTLCGRKVVYDYTSGGMGFISNTTSKHVGLAKRVATRHRVRTSLTD